MLQRTHWKLKHPTTLTGKVVPKTWTLSWTIDAPGATIGDWVQHYARRQRFKPAPVKVYDGQGRLIAYMIADETGKVRRVPA